MSVKEQVSISDQVGSSSGDVEWFVLKGKDRFGPFGYVDVVRMLQEKAAFEFDFIWCKGMEGWRRIAELPAFSPEAMATLYKKAKEEGKVFMRRNYPRGRCDNPVVIHDNNKVWKGRAIEISEGGAGVVIENAMLLPGQNVYMHFKGSSKTQPFNVLCEIISKQYVENLQNPAAAVRYGVKFINIQKQDREAIKTNIAA